jgi:hypothetical protein
MVHPNLLLPAGCFHVKSEEMAIRNGGHFEGEEEALVGREAIRLIGGGIRDMDEREEFEAYLRERSHDQLGGSTAKHLSIDFVAIPEGWLVLLGLAR